MAKVPKLRGEGGGNLPDVTPMGDSVVDDLTNLKAAIDAMAAKLNADAGVNDTDYAGAPALNTTKSDT